MALQSQLHTMVVRPIREVNWRHKAQPVQVNWEWEPAMARAGGSNPRCRNYSK